MFSCLNERYLLEDDRGTLRFLAKKFVIIDIKKITRLGPFSIRNSGSSRYFVAKNTY